jgi:hypothetical protein
VVWGIVCLVIAGLIVRLLYSLATAPDLNKVGWSLFWLVVVVAVILFATMIIRGKKWRGVATATGATLTSINWWRWVKAVGILVALVLLVFVGWKIIPTWSKARQAARAEATQAALAARIQEKEVIIGKEWSDPITVPLGYSVAYQSLGPLVYEVINQSGKRDTIFPDQECRPFPGKLARVRFRIIDEKVEKATIKVQIWPSWLKRACT